MKKRTYGTGSVHEVRKGTWELRYAPRNSKRLYKYVHLATRKDAEDELTAWRKQLDRQKNPGVRVPCSELLGLHFADMRRRQRDGKNILDQEKKAEKHLVPFFGSRETSSITVEDLNKYVDLRLKEGAKPATINRELSNLRRAFACGFEQQKIVAPLPKYKKLPENNVREGFVEHEVYRKVLNQLAAHLQMLWCFAYYLGIRKGELLKFRWDWLLPYWKRQMPIIKIPGKYCKNKKPHTIPLYHPEMRAMVEFAMTQRNPDCPYVFQYRGQQLKNFRTGFEKARQAARVSQLIFHDTRRTAVRNMVLAGIPEKRAMQISGHRTRSVFDRYDITTEKDAMDTGIQLERHWAQFSREETEEIAKPAERLKLGEKLGEPRMQKAVPTGSIQSVKLLN